MKKKLFTLLTLLCLCVTGAWADDVIFSMTSVTNGTTSVPAGGDLSITATYNTGSSAKVYNPTGGAKEMVSGTQINLKGSSSVYYVASFTVALQEGDIITSSNTAANTFYVAKNGGSKIAANFPYAIPENSPLIGETNLYVYKTGTSGTQATFTSFTITRPTGTQVPQISLSGNTVTLTCATSGATIYYTTDGTMPTTSSSSKISGQTFEIDNSCSVRAFAQKDDDASDETVKDCYITHSSALKVLGYNAGTVNEAENVWTSSTDNYTLTNTVEGRKVESINLNGTNDGFKLSHMGKYKLQIDPDVKVTKIIVVGKTLLAGNAGNQATISFTGLNPSSGSFYEYVTGGTTYLKTIEFTPTSDLDYGTLIPMAVGGNNLGFYIEIYGVKRSGPADPVHIGGDAVTWDFSSSDAQDAAGSITPNTSNDLKATDGTSKITYVAGNDSYEASSNKGYYIKTGGGSGSTRYFVLKISSNGSLGITSTGNNGEYVIKKAANSSTNYTNATNLTTITTESNGEEVQGEIVYDKDNPYLIIGFAAKKYTQKITWTPSSDDIELTTTAEMDGWRSFYDAENSYTVDGNTTIYIVKAKDDTKAMLKTVTGRIPASTPVILKTSAENYKMTLTKVTTGDPIDTDGNMLHASTAGQSLTGALRLGYGAAKGVGFYTWTTTNASAGIVYLSNESGLAKSLSLEFYDDNTTGINALDNLTNKQLDNDAPMYNLAGQRVNKSYKGVVIVNGKKMLNK